MKQINTYVWAFFQGLPIAIPQVKTLDTSGNFPSEIC